jgi:hypothetical protein
MSDLIHARIALEFYGHATEPTPPPEVLKALVTIVRDLDERVQTMERAAEYAEEAEYRRREMER